LAKPKKCGFKNCNEDIGVGAARVGFDNQGKNDEVIACAGCAWTIMTAPRGTYRITPDRRLEAIPQHK